MLLVLVIIFVVSYVINAIKSIRARGSWFKIVVAPTGTAFVQTVLIWFILSHFL